MALQAGQSITVTSFDDGWSFFAQFPGEVKRTIRRVFKESEQSDMVGLFNTLTLSSPRPSGGIENE